MNECAARNCSNIFLFPPRNRQDFVILNLWTFWLRRLSAFVWPLKKVARGMKDQTNEIISQTLCLDSIQSYCLIKIKKETDLSYEGVEMVLKWPSCWEKFMEEGIIVKHDPLGYSDTPGDADKRIPVRTVHDLRAIEGCPWLRHGGAEGDTCLRADQSNLGREDPASDGWQYNSEGLGTSFLDWVCLQCWWTIQKEGGKFVFSKVQLHFKSLSVKPPNCLLYPSIPFWLS